MNLYDDSTAHDLQPMINETETHAGGPAVVDAPEPAQPTPVEAEASTPEPVSPEPVAPETPAAAASDDFASALENFTTETEESVGDDHVIKGTVIKLTATHVVVDIGAK